MHTPRSLQGAIVSVGVAAASAADADQSLASDKPKFRKVHPDPNPPNPSLETESHLSPRSHLTNPCFPEIPYHPDAHSPKSRQVPRIQFVAALGDPAASSGTGAEAWGLWVEDPGPRGVMLDKYPKLEKSGGKAPAGWEFDSAGPSTSVELTESCSSRRLMTGMFHKKEKSTYYSKSC